MAYRYSTSKFCGESGGLTWVEAALRAPEMYSTKWDIVVKFSDLEDKFLKKVGGRCLVCDECNFNVFHVADETFICSRKCLFNAWSNFVEFLKQSGQKICSFPGCLQICGLEGSKECDYCTSDHYSEHKSLCVQVYGTRESATLNQCGCPGCTRLCPKSGFLNGYCCKKHKQRTGFCERCLQDKSEILFYESSSPYYEFSNFYEFAPFNLHEKVWQSSEQYFQAQKFIGTPYESIIHQLKSPREAFEYSRKFNHWKVENWEKVKNGVMYLALLAKFSTHERLRMLLFSTGERKLVEHTSNDSYWGDGGNGHGRNMLGELLMKVRRRLNKKKNEI